MTCKLCIAAALLLPLSFGENLLGDQVDPVHIGSRLEVFVSDFLIDRFDGDAKLHLHQPQPAEVVLVTDKPWEGNTCAYYSLFQDGDLYRMYYRGSHADEATRRSAHPQVTCYAESRDGINWTRPNLGLHEWEGSKQNNIVLKGLGAHCFVAFRDDNPDCPPEARYKGISRGRPDAKAGLYVFQSPDAVRWSLIQDEPVITRGAFDSQNLAFWDPISKRYVDYHRSFSDGVRAIMTCTSEDFVNWTEPVLLKYPGAPNQHLYTNAIRPYPRAPHIRIGFPTRYIPAGSQVEPIFMSSRDGVTFHRFDDPVIPRTAPKDRDGNRSNYMANALLKLPGKDREYSVYGTEAYYAGPDSRLRRFVYRVDGFVSVRGAKPGDEILSKPLRFTGAQLVLNYAAKAGGNVQVELQDAEGQPIQGFSMADCDNLSGDEIDQVVTWKGSADVSTLADAAVRLRIAVNNADVYSLRFAAEK